ncbi:hypothetical protein AX769_08455 [Frondihabitans sp. PAMC 28766]|uniref:HAAS signaling domain-containing protein n=1 Tax=Frondihabitans sp. PAMC 28766 TaxID=1795630 RepID=UPI00078E7244|nr:hypothetical protein [Frondihabitans sp. PAMC 28766]AMM20190.1 hypothetical protein AX769_08455 [Frondihabitans sp. PAMC 28766]
MNDTTPNNVTDYLTRLERELSDVAPDVRDDIVAGIREELLGLDPAGASARIDDLGDPAFIAAEARAATPEQSGRGAATPAAPGRASSIAAVVILIAGSIVVPFVGAVVGLAWISASRAWTRREKLTAWLVPIVVAILAVVLSLILASVHVSGSHVALLIAYLVFPVEGIVFAVRGARRNWYPAA